MIKFPWAIKITGASIVIVHWQLEFPGQLKITVRRWKSDYSDIFDHLKRNYIRIQL